MSHVDHIPSVAREATAGLRELRHLVGCLLLLICLGVSLIALPRPRHVKSTSPVNAENYARITLGMRQEEVEHVFGGPARREEGLNEPILLYPVPRSFPPAEVFTRNGLELRHGKRFPALALCFLVDSPSSGGPQIPGLQSWQVRRALAGGWRPGDVLDVDAIARLQTVVCPRLPPLRNGLPVHGKHLVISSS
jgi:hypothetical protein